MAVSYQEYIRAEYMFRMVLVGDSDVGKTSLIKQFDKDQFSSNTRQTVGVDFIVKTVCVDGHKCRVHIWDTAGQERFRSMISQYYRNVDGALIVYDTTKRKSFDAVRHWLAEAKEGTQNENAVIGIIGNKNDLEDRREISTEEGLHFAQKHQHLFTETSACKGNGVDEAFRGLVREMVKRADEETKKRLLDNDKIKSDLKRFSQISTTSTTSTASTSTGNTSIVSSEALANMKPTPSPVDLKKKKNKNFGSQCGC